MYNALFFFFNDTATTEIYTLSLHDALPISGHTAYVGLTAEDALGAYLARHTRQDRKSTRLNSSHVRISYAVFSLKKKAEIEWRVPLLAVALSLSLLRGFHGLAGLVMPVNLS